MPVKTIIPLEMPILPIHRTHELGEMYEWRQWRIALANQKKLEAAEKEAAQWRPAPTWRTEYRKPAFDNSIRRNIMI